ncbi:hypothetical protein SUGI_0656870 [Cryptomeria japonica]|nr:hypothetical protein SUGI_0656870 [Cryptomeria japonica]
MDSPGCISLATPVSQCKFWEKCAALVEILFKQEVCQESNIFMEIILCHRQAILNCSLVMMHSLHIYIFWFIFFTCNI